jgi:hypothetical protein
MNAMTMKRLQENKSRNQKKSSMTSRMSPETKTMFTLLAAKDWERKPNLNEFMKRLLERL